MELGLKWGHASSPQNGISPGSATSSRQFVGRLVLLSGLAHLVFAATGCTALNGLRDNLQYNDTINDAVLGWRNSVWARQAWLERRQEFACEPQFIAFGEGFRDGYADAAAGGNGCVPGLPPRKFWSWKYQTPEGQAKVAAWFAGYPHGARAAHEDGAANFQSIQVSHWIEAQYSQEFRNGMCPDCPTGPMGEHFPNPHLNGESQLPTPSKEPRPVIDPTSMNRGSIDPLIQPVHYLTPEPIRFAPQPLANPSPQPEYVPNGISLPLDVVPRQVAPIPPQ